MNEVGQNEKGEEGRVCAEFQEGKRASTELKEISG